MTEFWIISAPGDKTCQQTFDTMNNITSKQNSLCENFKMHIPDLKVGTLDQLVGLSDDLGKLDTYVEGITRKLAGYLGEVLEDQRDKLVENLLANNSSGTPDEESASSPEGAGGGGMKKKTDKEKASKRSGFSFWFSGPNTTSKHKTTKKSSTKDAIDSSLQFKRTSTDGQEFEDICDRNGKADAGKLEALEYFRRTKRSHKKIRSTSESSALDILGPSAVVDEERIAVDGKLRLNVDHHRQASKSAVHLGRALHKRASEEEAEEAGTNTGGRHSMHLLEPSGNHHCTFDWWFHRKRRSSKNKSRQQTTTTAKHHHRDGTQNGGGGQSLGNGKSVNGGPGGGRSEGKETNLQLFGAETPPPQIRNCCGRITSRVHKQRSDEEGDVVDSQLELGSGSSSSITGGGVKRDSKDQELEEDLELVSLQSNVSSSTTTTTQPDPLSPDDLPSYLTRFQWDIAKYPIKQSLRNIADIISKQVGQIDSDLKTKSTSYNSLKGNLQNLEKKQSGSLMTRSLADIVKKEHFILDSEYLTTLLVIVPKVGQQDWQVHYEKLTDMIVPRSTQMITSDGEFCLYTVTLFKKVADEFKLHAREKKFFVREFTYNEEELAAGKNEITKLVTDKKKQFGPLVRWLKVNFSECFCAWIHVKALRVFVESVLRYGLPVNFQAILMHPNKKSQKRLKDVLQQLYGHLDGSGGSGSNNQADAVDIPGLGFGQLEYYPYVCYKLNIDMVETKAN